MAGNYNPFGRPLDQISSGDLELLKRDQVAEGFFVEYKATMISPAKLAKSVSAFANSHGGLLFIGVEADTTTNVPIAFPGIALSELRSPKEHIRNIIAAHISPPPIFNTYLVDVESGRVVIVVEVPESREPPHINLDGRVYRRFGEGSDPTRPETAISGLDALYNKGREHRKRMEAECEPEQEMTRGQSDWCFLEIYSFLPSFPAPVCTNMLPQLGVVRGILNGSPLEFQLGGTPHKWTIGHKFHALRATSEGITAQVWQADDDGRFRTHQTPGVFSLFADGSLKVLMPLRTREPPPVVESGSTWDALAEHYDIRTTPIRYLDGLDFLLSTIAFLHSYIAVVRHFGVEPTEFHVKIRIRSAFRKCLIFETGWFKELVEIFGPPICYEGSVEVPRVGFLPLRKDADGWLFPLMQLSALAASAVGLGPQYRDDTTRDLVAHIFDLAKRGPKDGNAQ